MAEKPEELETSEDKIQRAKEMFSRGSRNFYVQAYAEAADDLSQACTIFADIHGPTADECAMPYLIYAKTLIALGTDENKVLDVPDEEDEEENGANENENEEESAANENEDDEDGGEDNDESENGEEKEEAEPNEQQKTNGDAKPEEITLTNGEAKATVNGSSTVADEAQPGTSTTNEAEDEPESGTNLEIAWEVLELAAIIFSRQGAASYEQLAETLTELAGISFENSHFEVAIKDFNKALEVYSKMEKRNNRHVAECHFQVGLCYSMLNSFQEAKDQLKIACELLDFEIESEKAKEQVEAVIANIKELEDVKKDIMDKIAEIDETKQVVSVLILVLFLLNYKSLKYCFLFFQSIEEVKKALAKVMSSESLGDGPQPSSSATPEKPKPTDISHLIKRKKPDVASPEAEASPAKKANLDQSQ